MAVASDQASPKPRAFRRFIGVSLGGGRGKTTAVARLELREDDGAVVLGVAEAKLRYGQRGTGSGADEPGGDAFFRDDVLVAYLRRWVDDDTVVAMDAPLTLPPCLRCDLACPGADVCTVPVVAWMRRHAPRLLTRGGAEPSKPIVTPYTQRATEILLERAGLHPREGMGQGTGPIAARAQHLRRMLSPLLRLHENLIEVHPRATLVRLFGARRERSTRQVETARVWETRKRMLDELCEVVEYRYVWPELVVRNGHVFAAVVSAFTAYLWSRDADDAIARGPLGPLAVSASGGDAAQPEAVAVSAAGCDAAPPEAVAVSAAGCHAVPADAVAVSAAGCDAAPPEAVADAASGDAALAEAVADAASGGDAALAEAVADLGTLWIEDGWIAVPAARRSPSGAGERD